MMKKKKVIILLSLLSFALQAQKKDRKIFKINKIPTYESEYKKLFVVDSDSLNYVNFDENLQLMLDYKLKLNQAKVEKIDTLQSLKEEFNKYKNNLAKPYLTDEQTIDKLVQEAYDRTQYKLRASHILIKSDKTDTLAAYQKIKKIREQLLNGANFNQMARKVSQDPSAKKNGGDLGYFNAFKMVYPFESAAYNTKVGEISEIVKTQFGYHVLKVVDRKSVGDSYKSAHIMIFSKTPDAEKKINEVYTELIQGKAFDYLAKKYSQDKTSARKGGVLNTFSQGTFPVVFEQQVMALKQGQFTKPFKTKFGWHIAKLYEKLPPQSFEQMQKDLRKKVMSRPRRSMVDAAVVQKIKDLYHPEINEEALGEFKNTKFENLVKDSLGSSLISIDAKEMASQLDFYHFIEKNRKLDVHTLFDQFLSKKLKSYFVDHLEKDNSEYKETLEAYQNGLVIFELMKKHIWDVPAKEPKKVKAYYQNHKEDYKEKGSSFESVKGYVQNDYQEMIQEKWLTELRETHQIKMCKYTLKKLKKSFKK